MFFNTFTHHEEAVIHGASDLLWVHLLTHGSKTGDVRKHNCCNTALGFDGGIVLAHRLLLVQKERALCRCQVDFKGWMSYSFNYKALWLYYKTKAFSMVMLSCCVVI